jgi:hypothetical protein
MSLTTSSNEQKLSIHAARDSPVTVNDSHLLNLSIRDSVFRLIKSYVNNRHRLTPTPRHRGKRRKAT